MPRHLTRYSRSRPHWRAVTTPSTSNTYSLCMIYNWRWRTAGQRQQQMTREKSIQNRLFAALYRINSEPASELLTLLLVALYAGQLLAAPLAPPALLAAPLLALLLAALTLALLAQLALALLYRVQVQLHLQLTLYRYLLFPPAVLILVAQLRAPTLLPLPAAAALLGGVAVLGYCVNFAIHSQGQSVFRQFEGCSNLFIITDCLFLGTRAVESFTYLQMVLLLILALHCLVRYRLRNYYFSSRSEQFEYFSLIVKDALIAITLVQNLLGVRLEAGLLLVFCAPLLLLAFLYECTRQRSFSLAREVFSGEASIGAFFEVVGAMSAELGRFKNNQWSELQESLLLVFVAVHKASCSNPSCLLLQRSTDEEIRNCSSLNNLKILKHKIIKKLEFLFELYEQAHGDSPRLKLLLISFYVTHLPNKLKLANLSSALKGMALSWGERLVFYAMSERIEGIEMVEELIDVSKTEDDYTEFKKLMSNAVGCFQEFWGRVLEEKVDVNQLMAISEKLFPLKKSIEQAWKRHLNEETFSSWSILKTYTYYRRTIMHDYTNSVILEGYCKIIEQRLKAKHEMSYINSETEQAVIAISLTESSLGNIASLNSQSCKLFNFASKSEMLELRVNDIMPGVYSVVHDNILSSFLKNRFKDINQDQRFVFGKNKNRFIFPFLLQLRKLSWNVNDELIFIAHLEPAKVRTAPIYCITDLEGDIQDYTSTFAWLFMKKVKNNSEIKRKNIQEMIPSFFEAIESVESEFGKRVRFTEKTYSHKNGQEIEIAFSASEVHIKSEKVGYLVEGQNSHPVHSFHSKASVSTLLSNFYHENNVYTNSYNPRRQCFELPNQTEMAKAKESREFTIPFIKTSDLEGILRYDQKVVRYDENIKTFRLFRGRLEHVVEEESFNSDEDIFELKELSVIKKIAKMKEELSVNEQSNTGDYFQIAVVVINALFLALMVVIISSAARFEAREKLEQHNIQHKLNIRQLFPEYLLYTFFPGAASSERRLQLRNDLRLNIVHSNIGQLQKEEIMRIIFSSQTADALALDPAILTFSIATVSTYGPILALWYVGAAGSFLYVVALLVIYCLFKFKISKIYTIFVSINENKLIQIKEEAQRLLEFLSLQSMEYNVSPLPDFKKDDLEEAEFHLMKKMKNDYTMQDLSSLSQLMLPALLILLYAIFCSIFMQASFSSYDGYIQAWLQSADLLPETSIALMQAAINRNGLGNLSLPTLFYSIEEQYEYIIVSGHFTSSEILPLLKGDPCGSDYSYSSIGVDTSLLCASSSAPLDLSFSNLINYLSSVLESSNSTAAIDWRQLISIEYDYFKPLLGYISELLKGQISEVRLYCERLIIVFGIIFICLAVLVATYIVCFPLNKIYERIIFTTDLIKILPSEKEAEPEQALAAMTTEAMETY